MAENRNRVFRTRLGRHVQRNISGYLALAVALSLSPAMASHLNVRTSDIANNAVTTPKIKNKAVSGPKMANLEGRHNIRLSQFSDGGEGDCIWALGSTMVPGLGRPHYYKDHLGIVHLGGIAFASNGPGGDGVCGNTEPEDAIVFRLPTAYRPQFAEVHGSGGGTSTIVVGRTALNTGGGGVVLPAGTVAITSEFDPPQAALDGVTFRASTAGGVSARVATLDREGRKLLRRLLGLDQ